MTSVTRAGSLLVAVTLALTASPASAGRSYGHTAAADGPLRDGCHGYQYHYAVDTPSNDWTMETFLKDPDGRSLASGVFLSDSESRKGTSKFRFCRYSTRAGVFTIRAKVHWYDAYNVEHSARLDPSRFRLRR